MEKKRLFIATFVDNSLYEFILPELKEEFNKHFSAKWTELNNLHFTYKFLGDVDTSKIPDLKKKLEGVLGDHESMLNIKGLGFFPMEGMPRVLFSKIYNPDKKVFQIYKNVESATVPMGFPHEKKKFRPHVSLARIKKCEEEPLREALNNNAELSVGFMSKFTVSLVSSELTHDGPIYTVID